MIGARRACIFFQSWTSPPSFSGSWSTATQTGPPTAFIFVAMFLAHASPLPEAIALQEYGAEKLIHGMRCLAMSAFALEAADAAEPEPQKVRWTPRFLP